MTEYQTEYTSKVRRLAYELGWETFEDELAVTLNPYNQEAGRQLYDAFCEGYADAEDYAQHR